MAELLPDWPRPHYRLPGGKPFLFYVVYGTFGAFPALSAGEYRSGGTPDGFELARYEAEQHADVLARFHEGYLWEQLQAQNPNLASRVVASSGCLILRGEIEDSDSLNYLRDTVGLLTFFLDHGGVTVYDPLMFRWWEPKEWRRHIFEPGGPVPRHHVVILTSEESLPSLTWFHTRGMRKFGRPDLGMVQTRVTLAPARFVAGSHWGRRRSARIGRLGTSEKCYPKPAHFEPCPDLSVHNVPPGLHDGVIDLCNRFIEFQAFGGVIEEGQGIRMRSLPEGMTCHHGGDLDDPDFNNVRVEIAWRQQPG